MITQEKLKELFDYREDGFLVRKYMANGRALADEEVGNDSGKGYYQTKIEGKRYLVHRLIFLFHHGFLPTFIDHIDGNRSNNRIENLRPATKEQNGQNMGKRKGTSTQFKGVSFAKGKGKWVAYISHNCKLIYLGIFSSPETAAFAYDGMALILFGEYARTNF